MLHHKTSHLSQGSATVTADQENVLPENKNCTLSSVTSVLTKMLLFFITLDGCEKQRGKKIDFLRYRFSSTTDLNKKANILAKFEMNESSDSFCDKRTSSQFQFFKIIGKLLVFLVSTRQI